MSNAEIFDPISKKRPKRRPRPKPLRRDFAPQRPRDLSKSIARFCDSALKVGVIFSLGIYAALVLATADFSAAWLPEAAKLSKKIDDLAVNVSNASEPLPEMPELDDSRLFEPQEPETVSADDLLTEPLNYDPRADARAALSEHATDLYLNKMSFISGLIAVYRPSIRDCGKVAKAIVEVSAKENIDPFYVAAIIATESSFRTKARSSVGALGLMQLMPGTAKDMMKKKTGRKLKPRLTDEMTNVRLGVEYIKSLEHRYGKNRYFALAAYNWGPANVDKAKKRGKPIPRSVHRYANKILEKTLNWRKHFERTKRNARKLERALSGSA